MSPRGVYADLLSRWTPYSLCRDGVGLPRRGHPDLLVRLAAAAREHAIRLPTHAAIAAPQIPWPADRKNWCWAAVTAAVVRHYADPKGKPRRARIEPCEVVEKLLPGGTGCGVKLGSTGDAYRLERALASYGHLDGYPIMAPPAPGQAIHALAAGRPVGVGLGWAGQPRGEIGHFAQLVEADIARGQYVWDPKSGLILDALRGLAHGYPGGGVWKCSFFTKPWCGPRQQHPSQRGSAEAISFLRGVWTRGRGVGREIAMTRSMGSIMSDLFRRLHQEVLSCFGPRSVTVILAFAAVSLGCIGFGFNFDSIHAWHRGAYNPNVRQCRIKSDRERQVSPCPQLDRAVVDVAHLPACVWECHSSAGATPLQPGQTCDGQIERNGGALCRSSAAAWGRVDGSHLVLRQVVFQEVVDLQATSLASVEVDGSHFLNGLDLRNSNIEGMVRITDSTMARRADDRSHYSLDLRGAKVDQGVRVRHSTLAGELSLNGSYLRSESVVALETCAIDGEVTFDQMRAYVLSLSGSTFGGETNLNNVSVDAAGDLQNASFNRGVTMINATFGRLLNATCAEFGDSSDDSHHAVDAWNLHAHDVLFTDARFIGSVSLSDTNTDGTISFRRSRFVRQDEGGPDVIAVGAHWTTLNIDDVSRSRRGGLEDGMVLEGFGSLTVEEVRSRDFPEYFTLIRGSQYGASFYSSLEESLRKHGLRGEANMVFLASKRHHASTTKGLAWPFYQVMWLIGYGRRPFVFYLGFVILFAACWYWVVSSRDGLARKGEETISELEKALYALTSILPDFVESDYEKDFTARSSNFRLLFKFLGWAFFSLALYSIASLLG